MSEECDYLEQEAEKHINCRVCTGQEPINIEGYLSYYYTNKKGEKIYKCSACHACFVRISDIEFKECKKI